MNIEIVPTAWKIVIELSTREAYELHGHIDRWQAASGEDLNFPSPLVNLRAALINAREQLAED